MAKVKARTKTKAKAKVKVKTKAKTKAKAKAVTRKATTKKATTKKASTKARTAPKKKAVTKAKVAAKTRSAAKTKATTNATTRATTKAKTRVLPKLQYNAISAGDEAPVVSHKLTRTDLVRYAGASGDFNPMHTDEVAAKEAGLPSVFGHGMFSMGLLGRAVTNWAGAGNLQVYSVRFTRQTWPGETLSTKIVVTGKEETAAGKVIIAELTLHNQDGEAKLSGTARVLAA